MFRAPLSRDNRSSSMKRVRRGSRDTNSGSFQSKYTSVAHFSSGMRSNFSASTVSRGTNSIENDHRKQDDRRSSEQEHDDLSLGKLPDQSERIQEGVVMKLCQDEWQRRFIVVTGRYLI